MGVMECELSDFKSERVVKRDFFKQFQGKLIHPILSWGLHVINKNIPVEYRGCR